MVQEAAHKYLDGHPRIHLIAPLAVDEMHNLMGPLPPGDDRLRRDFRRRPPLWASRCWSCVGRPSGPRAVQAGTVKLAGVEEETIFSLASELLTSESAYAAMAHAVNPYGDGRACRRIADAIEWRFGTAPDAPGGISGVIVRTCPT